MKWTMDKEQILEELSCHEVSQVTVMGVRAYGLTTRPGSQETSVGFAAEGLVYSNV